MQTKLTLRLEQRLIRRAKAYARRTGKSVSELVADFFGRLEATPEERGPRVVAQSPAVQSLVHSGTPSASLTSKLPKNGRPRGRSSEAMDRSMSCASFGKGTSGMSMPCTSGPRRSRT